MASPEIEAVTSFGLNFWTFRVLEWGGAWDFGATGTWAIGLGNSRRDVIHSPIEMKPLHPAVKYPLAIFLAAMFLIPPAIKAFGENEGDRTTREVGEQLDKFNADMEKMRAEKNNR